jgi:chromatin segregation and condensation protein Rec8/ScpA/Scc1 (kleisin family)
LFELIDAIRKILQTVEQESFFQAPSPLVPLENKMDEILARLDTLGQILLEALLPSPFTRAEIIVVFLALLELVRQHKILIYQQMYGEKVHIFKADPPAQLS